MIKLINTFVDEKSEMILKPWLAHFARVDSLLPKQEKSLLHASDLFSEIQFLSNLKKNITMESGF